MASLSVAILTSRPSRLSLWAPVIIYMAAIFWASSVQDPQIPSGSDKPLHGMAYFGLALIVVRAVAGGLPRRIDMRTTLMALAITVGYAASDELHQRFVPGRSADLYDLAADAGGSLGGTVVGWAIGLTQRAGHKGI